MATENAHQPDTMLDHETLVHARGKNGEGAAAYRSG
ncbi:hypothetical protein NITHO_1760008 [Nitrolancea hollandica Lb]|uniref:Uncharacterized protein n=1 Tax=Nitrolancea hollandica Lb TaxID=1129897 RepID=I4EEA3_9BACT|nr:hypothetical protein NITHO_1760008 [Nitrolancea hollandica Lb]